MLVEKLRAIPFCLDAVRGDVGLLLSSGSRFVMKRVDVSLAGLKIS